MLGRLSLSVDIFRLPSMQQGAADRLAALLYARRA
jgi:hypothetical protein